MIVKNESHVIEKTFDNLAKYITFDYWVICDTGSTDGTQDLIRNYFAKKGIPGELVQHEWKDFGHNRTLSLRAGYNKSDYLLIFDADDSIHGDFKLPAKWSHDAFCLKLGSGMTYYRPQLINNRKKWMYVGVLHEYLKAEEPVNGELYMDGDYYIDSGKTGDRSKDPQKYHKDAQILKAAYYKEKEAGNDLANRYAFYCAQSFKDSNQVDDAIEWYTLVADTLPNWTQEKYYSCIMLGQLYDRKNNFEKCIQYFTKSIRFDPERIEGIVFACEKFRQKDMHEAAMALYHRYKKYNPDPKNKLFLFRQPYEGTFECTAAISASHTNEKELGYSCAKKVILNDSLPVHLKCILFDVLRFYMHELTTDSDSLDIFYILSNIIHHSNNEGLVVIWNLLFKKHKDTLIKNSKPIKVKSKSVEVFLSFTSCKRLDLFEQTVNSILNHFLDKEKIDYWFCVDDNSSESDRTKMKKKYPWIVFYDKTESEKGHRPSMNIIWNKMKELNPKYWIHIEDDFLFHSKKNYITDSINFLKQSGNVKQVLFNRNYAETAEDIRIGGHLPLVPGFVLHDYKNDTVNYPNCHYWPHYSFRPGVIDAQVILSLGNFDSPNTFFEMDYAHRWTSSGYKTAFFDGINCRHIGRLTKDKNSDTIKNAYDLNNESQFAKACPLKVINLKRRPDRKEHVTKVFTNAGITDIQFVEAIDGSQLKPNIQLKKLFEGNDFGSRVGVIGCALTHYNLWKSLLVDNANHYYAIFEDDIFLTPRFKQTYDALRPELAKFECLFLGYHMFTQHRQATKDTYVVQSNTAEIGPNNKNLNIGGTFGYTINKAGAKTLVEYIEKNGIRHGIDYVMKICSQLKSLELRPQIVFSEWYETPGQNVDSDIQKDGNALNFGSVVDYTDKFEFKAGVDQMGNDSYHHSGKSIYEMMEIAIADSNCTGFNTLGFFKNKIENLTRSPYFGSNDGVFIKKEFSKKSTDKIRVKMICDWQSSEKLIEEWSLMPVPQNIELTTSDDADFHVVINKPGNGTFDPSKTIHYQMEPTVYDPAKNWGAKTWPKIDVSKFYRIQHHNYLNGVQWNFPILDNFPVKTNDVVSILSGNNWDFGHQLRIAFVRENQDLFKVFGKQNFNNFECYRGKVPDENRSNVYSKVKYCLACENNAETNYATEKIWEPILNEVLAFYWGCPNLEDYIDPKAFVRLPLEDFDAARKIIDQAIAEDWWSQRIDVIRSEKNKIQNIYGFFPNLQRAVTRTKAVIITLKEFDRSEMIKKTVKLLSKLGIETEIFYGVNGKNIENVDNKLTYEGESYSYDPKARLNGKPMTPGEFGCAWSHLSVYKKLIADPKFNNYLVLEDDIELCDDLHGLNNAIANLPKKYDICHIGKTIWYPFEHTESVNDTYFNVKKNFFNGTISYFVSKDGANKLVSDSLSLPSDDRLSNSFIGDKITVYAPKKHIFQQTSDVTSIIETLSNN
jgi:GR25 family glycosyltransferase involved in LPS biosynthesis/tetratricopeptide (TPR) repeat protein